MMASHKLEARNPSQQPPTSVTASPAVPVRALASLRRQWNRLGPRADAGGGSIKEPRQRADLLAYLKDTNKPGHAPKAAQGGGQMGGMMMGGGQVPNLKVLHP